MSRPGSVAPSSQRKKRRQVETEDTESPTPDIHDISNADINDITVRPPVFVPTPEGSPYCLTPDTPTNRGGYKYTPMGPAPKGLTLSYRSVESCPTGYVRASWEDRSPFVRVTQDGLGLAGDKGFRSARLNVPVREGKWYMEIYIENDGVTKCETTEGAHVRLGWARREAPLNGPAGLDGYSYGFRDKTGEKITLSRPRPYGRAFGAGDTIGLYISLPPHRQADPNDPHDPNTLRHKRIPIFVKNQLYFEVMEYAATKEMISLANPVIKPPAPASVPTKKSSTVKNAPSLRNKARPVVTEPMRALPLLPGSAIAFFINGECQGTAFQDVYDYALLRATTHSRKTVKRGGDPNLRERENDCDDGSLGYYPFISLFGEARVRINAGPEFKFPPPLDIDAVLEAKEPQTTSTDRTWRPLCERYSEYIAEVFALDTREEEEATSRAAEMDAEEERDAERKATRDRKRKVREDEKKKLVKKETSSRQVSVDIIESIVPPYGDLPAASDPSTPNFDPPTDVEADIDNGDVEMDHASVDEEDKVFDMEAAADEGVVATELERDLLPVVLDSTEWQDRSPLGDRLNEEGP